jgi:hypothetical protein
MVDLQFDWFGISCMTTEFFCFYLHNRLIQTRQTGGQQYSDTSPFSIPCFSQQDETWAEFSTLEEAMCVHATYLCCYQVKLLSLKLKTRPKQLICYLPLDITLHAIV